MSKSSKKTRQAAKRRKELEKLRGVSLLDAASPAKPLESSPTPGNSLYLTDHGKSARPSSAEIENGESDRSYPSVRDENSTKRQEAIPFGGDSNGLSNQRKQIEFVLPRAMGKAQRYMFDKQARAPKEAVPAIPEEDTLGKSVLKSQARKKETLNDILFSNKKCKLADKFEAVHKAEETKRKEDVQSSDELDAPAAPVKKKPKKRRRRSSSGDKSIDGGKKEQAYLVPIEGANKRKLSSESLRSSPSTTVGNNSSDEQSWLHDEDTEMLNRRLSGRSVEQAVQDKPGLRPRANSTDGELNLPQRGLCDEQMVLRSHQWEDKHDFVHQIAPRGFANLGNTCFLNSILQCLAYSPPFCQTLIAISEMKASALENGTKATKSHGQRITSMICKLFQKVHGYSGISTQQGSIAPQALVKSLPSLGNIGSRDGYKFWPGRQEDAHEFLVHLLDAMHDGELRAAGINQHVSGWRDRLPVSRLDETTFVHRIFGGYFRSQVRCKACGYCSNTYDPFLDLSLEVSKKSSNSILHAIAEFTRKETLDSNNRWKCSGCKKYVCPTKQLTVFRPPLCLCIQLKRFAFDGGFGGQSFSSFGAGPSWKYGKSNAAFRGRSKITKPIEFPSELNLPLSDGRSCPYDLTGVVIHVGGSASSGHYTAYMKQPGKKGRTQWYHADDSFVEPVSEKTALRQKNAYILFYCRKEVKLEFPSPPPRDMSTEEAKEFGRARARARIDSATAEEEAKPSNEVPAENGAAVRTKADIHPLAEFFNATVTEQFKSGTPSVPKTTGGSEVAEDEGSEGSVPSKTSSEEMEPTRGGTVKSEKRRESEGSFSSKSEKARSTEFMSKATFSGEEADGGDIASDASANSPRTKRASIKGLSQQKQGSESSSSRSSSGSESSEENESEPEREGRNPGKRSPAERNTGFPETERNVSTSSGESSGDDSESEGEESQGNQVPLSSGRFGQPKSGRTHSSLENDSANNDASKETSEQGESCFDRETSHNKEGVVSTLARPAAHGIGSISPEMSKSRNGSDNKTRVVVGNADSRGKVKVMLGPRKRQAWVPKALSTTQKGAAFQLLGNRDVSKWDEEEDKASASQRSESAASTPTQREQIVKKLEKQETTRKRKMHLDRWDALLDQGKVKKMKKNSEATDSSSFKNPKKNLFQTIQSSVQRMNKGRAKGLFRRKEGKKGSRKNGRH